MACAAYGINLSVSAAPVDFAPKEPPGLENPVEAAPLPALKPAEDVPANADGEDRPAGENSAETVKPSTSSAMSQSFGNYLSGRFAESLGDTSNGIHYLRESLKRDPGNKDILSSLYRMLILSGEVEEAVALSPQLAGIKVVEEGSEFSPEMLHAMRQGKNGQYAEAAQSLENIPKAGFNNLLVPLFLPWLTLGEHALKGPVDARSLMPDAHVILPHVYLNAAFINDLAGFDDAALKQYEAAVKDPRIEPFRAVEALDNYYARKGMTARRAELVNRYLAQHGDSFLAEALLAAPPNDTPPTPLVGDATQGMAEVLYTVANIFHGVRAPADEIATLHLALYLRPDFPAAQFLLASAYELGQDYGSAIATYNAISPRSAYYARGRIRSVYDESEMGNKDKALLDLDALAAANPHDVDPLLAKGDILRAEDKYEQAADAYTQAVSRLAAPKKHHWILFFSRGTCFERLGEWDKAEADMKKALQLSPGEPDVLNYLGYSWLVQHRNTSEAKRMIEAAYEARPEDAHIIDSMGFAFYMSGDFTSAVEYFEQALERTPDDATVNSHLGDTYWQLGRKTEARYQWQRALTDNPGTAAEKELRHKLDKGLVIIHASVPATDKTPSTVPASSGPETEE